MNTILDAIKARRSVYDIGPERTISDEELENIIKQAVLHIPSAFNSQTGRVVLLRGQHSKRLWEIVKEALFKINPPERHDGISKKIDGFAAGYGTILFFEESNTIKEMEERFKTYAHNFKGWSLQSSGMLQFVIWTELAFRGMGASIQHYNELIEDAVKAEWNLPQSWILISQMPFGKTKKPAGEKEFLPLEDRIKLF